MQVFLLLKTLQQQITKPRVNLPIDITYVIARRILAMIGKLDSAAQLPRPPLGQKLPAKNSPRNQRQVFQT